MFTTLWHITGEVGDLLTSLFLVIAFFTLSGLNFSFWALVGIIRFALEKISGARNFSKLLPETSKSKKKGLTSSTGASLKSGQRIQVHSKNVAALIPAHNEEAVISKTITSLKQVMPAKNIYVGSDNSTDKTATIVRALGCNVVEIVPNRGKAGVLDYVISHFKLCKHYKAVLIIDADTEIHKDYFKYALPLFNDPQVVAVAGHASSAFDHRARPRLSMFYAAYRTRLYRVIQALVRYGQTWSKTNVTTIVPGFASMYRTSVLPSIDITAPGLSIEDYNMTFEVHHKKLGKVAYSPKAYAITHDPYNMADYINQVKRWNLGFWQTVRKHGVWVSFFWFANGLYIFEMFFYAVFFIIVPFLFIWMALHNFEPLSLAFLGNSFATFKLTFMDLLFGVFFFDYISTIIVASYEKKPVLLAYGFGFTVLRYIDSLLFLYTLPLAFFVKSEGKWVSPKR